MLAYWAMYLTPAIPALFVGGRSRHLNISPWVAMGVLFSLLIGFRYQVGGDWFSYLYQYDHMVGAPFWEAVSDTDPGYGALNWLMARWGWGINGVNFFCSAIFVAGLSVFCRQQPRPWLAFTIAVPYLVVVVAMGYTRQGVALGFLFFALSYLERGDFKRYILFIVAAALFHRSAVLMIPLGLFLYGKGRIVRGMAVVMTAYVTWYVLLAEDQEQMWNSYVTEQMVSDGAKIRVWMNLVPSVLMLIYWKRWKRYFPNTEFWLIIAIGSIASVLLVDYATTAVDRVALYFTPIQVAVLSRLPLLMRRKVPPRYMAFGIVSGYAAVLFVWLNYASHSEYWIPYQSSLTF